MSTQTASSFSNPLSDDLEFALHRTRDLWEDLRGQRLFITGGTGWIGSWLLESFCWANSRLNLKAHATVLTRTPEAFQRLAPHLAFEPAIKLHPGDIRNCQFPNETFSFVIHGANESSAKLNREDPVLVFDTIVEGTRRSLEFAHACGARKFLLLSSGAVYGKQPLELSHVPESYSGAPDPLDPTSAYHHGKRAAELLCVLMGSSNGIEIKIARCFTFVGPYMKLDAHFAIGNFIGDRLKGGPIIVHGDGSATRSYMYMSDLIVWLWTILIRGEAGRAYNVGSEHAISVAELAQEVARLLSPALQVRIEGKSGLDVAGAQRYVPSTQRAQQELGLRQHVLLGDAIRRTHAWFRRKQQNAA